jgi:hypothetical protein
LVLRTAALLARLSVLICSAGFQRRLGLQGILHC